MYITNVNSGVITVLSLESVSIGGDGRIFQTYGDSGVEYSYDFYLKDHLGSTRMVINSQDQITEAVAYQAYGAMIPLDSIANAPEIPAREKFTGKEFDQEGEDSANGVIGIQAYHFGARVYDPDIGVWLAVDAAGQYLNPYGYSTNPVIMVDPDGNYFIGAIIGGAIGFAAGGLIGGAISGEDWSWSGALQGMMMGASIGSGIENSILASRFGPGNFNIPRTAYGRAAMMDMYKPILARGASYPSSDNVNVNELPPELQNNAQRVYRNEIRNYLSNNPAPYDPNCSSCSEVTQYAKFEGGKYKFSHDVGECIQTNGGYQNVTARLRSGSLSSYVDISHTHPGAGGIPTGYQQKGLFTVTHGNSDMSFFNKAYGQGFRGTMHVYDVPNEIFYQFMPSAKNSLILDFRIITQ